MITRQNFVHEDVNICPLFYYTASKNLFPFFFFFVVILQVVKNNLNPSWMSFSIALATLCGGDYDAPIRVSSIIMIIIIIIIINSNYYQFNLKVDKICVT